MPLFGRAARRLLAINATGVASESVFSDAGRYRGNLRGGLDKRRLRMLTLLHNWAAKTPSNTLPSIPLRFGLLSATEKTDIMSGKTIAALNDEALEVIAQSELAALKRAQQDGREKKVAERNFNKVVLEEEGEEEGAEEEEDGGITAEVLDDIDDSDDDDDDDDE